MKGLIVTHDPTWKVRFSIESDRIQKALGNNAMAIHHIGSTSIPRIFAKPIIDILVEVARIEKVDERVDRMRDLNYEVMGEYGNGGRRYYIQNGIPERGFY